MANKKKTVILIGGTSFSGSTIIDLILSNRTNGLSVGEQYALFFPSKPHHLTYGIDKNPQFINFWEDIKRRGAKQVFRNIFNKKPEVDYIVDSSKDLYWIHKQNKYLKNQGYQVKNVVVWKDPEAFAKSFLKRGKKNWDIKWVNYYKYYLTLVNNPIMVNLGSFLNNEEYTKQICDKLNIKFEKQMLEYWHNNSYTLFGSTSTKISLYEKDSAEYNTAKRIIAKRPGKSYNSSFYKEVVADDRIDDFNEITEIINSNPTIAKIQQILSGQSENQKPVSRARLFYKMYKSRLKSIVFLAKNLAKNSVRS